MEIYGFWQVFGGGVLGAALVEAIKLANRLQGGRPIRGRYRYVISVVLLLGVGGVTAGMHADQVRTLRLAGQLGVAAPALIGAWVTGARRRRAAGVAPAYETKLSRWIEELEW